MDATLKIKNVSTNPVTVEPAGGDVAPVEIAPDGDADLGEFFLSGKNFRAHLASGNLRFVETPSPTGAQFHLARRVLPRLLKTVGGPIVALHDLLDTSKESLEGQRADYNRRHDAAKAVIQQGKDQAKPATNLYRGCQHFLNTKLEEADVSQAESDIADLEAEDLSVTGRTLEEWYADREAAQEALEAAQAALAAATARYVTPLANLKQAVDDAATNFAAANPNTDIGTQLPPFP